MKIFTKLYIVGFVALGVAPLKANDSIWRLDSINVTDHSPTVCADKKNPSDLIAEKLISFGEIVYGMNEAGSRYDSWFVGEFARPEVEQQVKFVAFKSMPEHNIPVETAPVEISRGETKANYADDGYYPEYQAYEQGYNYDRAYNTAPEYRPEVGQITMQNDSASHNEPEIETRSIRYYPYR